MPRDRGRLWWRRGAGVALALLLLASCRSGRDRLRDAVPRDERVGPSATTTLEPHPAALTRLADGTPVDWSAVKRLVDLVAAETMAERNIPGAAVVIVHRGEVVLAKGYGHEDAEATTAVSADRTIFRIGSITKVLTAVALAQLIDRGRLSLHDDLARHLPLEPLRDPTRAPVRTWHLLTHTAGFDQIGTSRQVGDPLERPSLREFLEGNLVRIREPGLLACYDTYGITLAGHLIERISGMSYAEYLREQIFEPLGMTRTAVEVAGALRDALAVGYGLESGALEAQPYEIYVTTPASSVDASPSDMGRLMIALLGDGSNAHGRILSPAAADRIRQAQFTNEAAVPGFAWGFWEDLRNGQRAIHHGGIMAGYTSELYLLPEEGIGLFVAANRDPETGSDPRLRELLIARLMDQWYPDPARLEPPPYPADLERFAGAYSHCLYCHTCFEGEGWGRNVVSVRSVEPGVLEALGARWIATGPLSLREEGGSRMMRFRLDAAGQVRSMLVGIDLFERNGAWLIDETLGKEWREGPVPPLLARVRRADAMFENTPASWRRAAEADQSVAARRPGNGRAHYYAGTGWLAAGEPERALEPLQRAWDLGQWRGWTAYALAAASARRGDRESAFVWLGKAFEHGYSDRGSLARDPAFETLRSDPRWNELVEPGPSG